MNSTRRVYQTKILSMSCSVSIRVTGENFLLTSLLFSLASLHVSVSRITHLYEVPDAVPPIHAVSSHVATDKDPSK